MPRNGSLPLLWSHGCETTAWLVGLKHSKASKETQNHTENRSIVVEIACFKIARQNKNIYTYKLYAYHMQYIYIYMLKRHS